MNPTTDNLDFALPLQLLPQRLLAYPLAGSVPGPALALLAARGITTFGELLTGACSEPLTWLPADARAAVRAALDGVLARGLTEAAPDRPFDPTDWPSQQAHLLLPLDDAQRALLRAVLGIDQAPTSAAAHARATHTDLRSVEGLLEHTRRRLHERAQPLLSHLRAELKLALAEHDGVLDPGQIRSGTMLGTMADANDPQFGLRLAAFCFPHEYHLHEGRLYIGARKTFRRLVDLVRATVARHRLPLPLDELLAEIEADRKGLPRGFLVHVLRTELRLSVAHEDGTDVIVPDARTTAARLVAVLEEDGRPLSLTDLVFAYRERYRRATPSRIEQCVRRDPTFVLVGRDVVALRRWFVVEIQAAAELADRTAHHVVAEGGKQNVLQWLADRGVDERTAWLVLDRLAADERVRLLGRGDACPATHRQSQVLVQLLTDFRRACGDVVESLFVQNQPEHRRRLVQRLLDENRMFVRPGPDRVDTLSNYPFNEQRLERTEELVRAWLEAHGGHATLTSLKDHLDATELGGSWLQPELLGEVLRRHGWFDVLPGGVVALRDRALPATLLRLARQRLREAGVQLTVEEIVSQRPDLRDFAGCLEELLQRDPLVQSPDGRRFCLL
ncbi:MAG: hypothetical protein U1E73_08910 [Planctomycetota bacterium]